MLWICRFFPKWGVHKPVRGRHVNQPSSGMRRGSETTVEQPTYSSRTCHTCSVDPRSRVGNRMGRLHIGEVTKELLRSFNTFRIYNERRQSLGSKKAQNFFKVPLCPYPRGSLVVRLPESRLSSTQDSYPRISTKKLPWQVLYLGECQTPL